ncbi:ATP-dependent zinc metalloprotease FtsH [Geosporobacter ferrireducens]|uniref:ATP-dependent zinc metalloprotease FtsH n=1 Tax=Geosporobacter ferrireducens TaxID=1424294 RepID=A0A1D8GP49_9FIRM|nr:ATP-dependent zinc metalloprotease FtsH [Geosporobacter ferrireducens]AOT72665.1 cell division protein FtsH [Geosporobacter ferrireducens]MTI55070.1 ATP-dependent zinc metalloprotease FtsH [Geosporobacter ferrireducens]
MKINKKLIIALLLIVTAGAIGFGLYFQTNTNSDVKEVSYNEFLAAVQGGQVSTVYLVDEAKIKGEFSNGTAFITDNPRTENFKEILLKNHIKVEEHKANSAIMNVLSTFGVILLISALGVYLTKQSSKQTSREFSRMSNFEAIPQGEIKITFSQVAGNEEAKESILDLVDFLRNPEKYGKYGARIPRGVILYGPPGTGKTLLAKALAGEAGVPFYAVSGSDFIQIYAGLGAGRIRSLFKKAREKGKCVIFIDEIDALGKKRDGLNGNDESDRTLNALLTEMSGFNENEGIIVIAATNRLDTLDDALLRPGRFDRQIEVGLPDVKARHQILKVHSQQKPLAQSIDLGKLAHQTVYFSGAELESLLNEAAILAAKQNAQHIDIHHIDKAFYTVIAGEEKKDRSMISNKDREITAYHEAGHALMTKLIAPENKVTKVTIIPSTKGAGGFSMNIPPDRMYRSKKEMIQNIQIALAGRIAEEIIYGEENITTGASNDIEKATEIIASMVKHFGMNKKAGMINYDVLYGGRNAGADTEVVSECRRIMEELYMETKQLLQVHMELLVKITELLLDKETLNEEDLNVLIVDEVKAAV